MNSNLSIFNLFFSSYPFIVRCHAISDQRRRRRYDFAEKIKIDTNKKKRKQVCFWLSFVSKPKSFPLRLKRFCPSKFYRQIFISIIIENSDFFCCSIFKKSDIVLWRFCQKGFFILLFILPKFLFGVGVRDKDAWRSSSEKSRNVLRGILRLGSMGLLLTWLMLFPSAMGVSVLWFGVALPTKLLISTVVLAFSLLH